jgi:replicative DNA helicase
VIVADALHQWLTETRASRRSPRIPAEVRTTEQLAATLRCDTADGRLNHSVANAAPLDLPHVELPVPPYVLGAWLGDGHTAAARITTADPELVLHLEDEGVRVVPSSANALTYSIRLPAEEAPLPSPPNPAHTCPDCGAPTCGLVQCQDCHLRNGTVQARLRTLGVLGDKHIPAAYLRASEPQRRALLAGLMDTDGTVMSTGQLQFCGVSRRLADGVRELVSTLGYRCSMTTKAVRGRTAATSTAYIVNFTTSDDVFRLERKRLVHKERRGSRSDVRNRLRYVTAVRPVPSVPVRCVEVDNADHLYLASRSMIPTHNSTLGLDFARSASIKSHKASVIFSLEMSKHEITMRLLSAEARVSLQNMRTGRMTDDDWSRLARRMGEVANAPLFIDDSPNLTMMEIRAKARRLKQRQNLELIVVDYMQLMSSPKRVENRQQEVSEISRSMKLLAKELDVPVVAISQLNRGPEARTDKKPQLSDLRESGSLEQDADMVILLYREDAFEKESPRAGEADFIVAKHRNGPTGTITVAFQGHYSRFMDMTPTG